MGQVGVMGIENHNWSRTEGKAQGRRNVCPHCGKSFAYPKDLRRHILTHTGEKPFGCPFCSHRANHKSNLKMHIFCVHEKEIS